MKVRVKLVSLFLGLCLVCSLVSCKGLPDLPGTQVLRVDNQQIESILRKHDESAYTLVFENGSRNCIQRWATLLQQLPDNLNVYAYNRPGYCNSSSATTDRASANVVNELRQSLRQQGLNPPYILIGHSLGGLYMQHFARQHPDEVKGLVLVDAIYPGVLKSPDEFPWYTKTAMTLFISGDMKDEIYRANASSEMIDSLPAIDHMPIVRLFNQPTSKIEDGSAKEIDLGMLNRDEKVITKIRNLYPRAKIVVADSSHQMQETSPELVVQAINDVIQAKGAFQ